LSNEAESRSRNGTDTDIEDRKTRKKTEMEHGRDNSGRPLQLMVRNR
jgi:hypothetical protein